MYLNSRLFWLLILLSIVLILVYQWGVKKNVSFSRKISNILEAGLKAKDSQYTWLGGVLGFSARYLVDGFKKVEVILRLFPRHSLLYWPIAMALGHKDNLKILFYLEDKNKIYPEEFHLIEKSYNTYIKQREQFKNKEIKIKDKLFILLYKNKIPSFLNNNLILSHSESFFKCIRHIAYTKENSILYFEFVSITETALKTFLSKLDLFYNINCR